MIDVSGCEDIYYGEEVVLIGKQGDLEITIYDMGTLINTIPNEILTNIGSRVKRIYKDVD